MVNCIGRLSGGFGVWENANRVREKKEKRRERRKRMKRMKKEERSRYMIPLYEIGQ